MKIRFSGHDSDGEFFIYSARSFEEFGVMAYNLVAFGSVIENVEIL